MASQSALRDGFIKQHPTICYGMGEWREYKDGVWEEVNELVIKRYIQQLISASGSKLTSTLVNQVVELVKPQVYIPSKHFNSNPNILTFADCCLDLVSYQTVRHAKEFYATTKLGFAYDPTAQSPAWTEVEKRFPNRDFLQEFAGYCMTIDTSYEVAVWLHGPAGGGKSTFITGLKTALGERSCGLGLAEVEATQFSLTRIPGRTLAISTEQPSHYIKCVHLLNALISGESVTINQKFKAPFEINPTVKLLWAMNELPTIPSGAGAGLFRRVYPIYWPLLSETDRDPRLKEEIQQSGMAIVNWSLAGLKTLRARGNFLLTDDLKKARDEYKADSDVTLCFLNEVCDTDDQAEIQSSTLYEAYGKWCDDNRHRPFASNRFSAEMKRLGFDRVKRATGNYWQGVELKPDFPDLIV